MWLGVARAARVVTALLLGDREAHARATASTRVTRTMFLPVCWSGRTAGRRWRSVRCRGACLARASTPWCTTASPATPYVMALVERLAGRPEGGGLDGHLS